MLFREQRTCLLEFKELYTPVLSTNGAYQRNLAFLGFQSIWQVLSSFLVEFLPSRVWQIRECSWIHFDMIMIPSHCCFGKICLNYCFTNMTLILFLDSKLFLNLTMWALAFKRTFYLKFKFYNHGLIFLYIDIKFLSRHNILLFFYPDILLQNEI